MPYSVLGRNPLAFFRPFTVVLLQVERMGPLNSTPSTIDISPRLYQEPAMHLLPSNVPPPNPGLTQYEWGRMKLSLCAKTVNDMYLAVET